MRVLLQRVTAGSVTVDGRVVGQIGRGLVLLVGSGPGDDALVAMRLAEKIAQLRIFEDDAGKINRSLLEVEGEALVVSQFTLYADARKGRRPSFTNAAPPDLARQMVDQFTRFLQEAGIKQVATGIFGADMQVAIHNDGPVTLWLDSQELGLGG